MSASEHSEQIRQLLAHALADLTSALSLMQAPGIELPRGVEAPESGCVHPRWRTTFGGHGYCPDCGASK